MEKKGNLYICDKGLNPRFLMKNQLIGPPPQKK